MTNCGDQKIIAGYLSTAEHSGSDRMVEMETRTWDIQMMSRFLKRQKQANDLEEIRMCTVLSPYCTFPWCICINCRRLDVETVHHCPPIANISKVKRTR